MDASENNNADTSRTKFNYKKEGIVQYLSPCLYTVGVASDGFGDFYNYCDFLFALSESKDELDNALFVIHNYAEESDKVGKIFIDTIDSLDKNHPFKKYPEKLIIATSYKELVSRIKQKIGTHKIFNFYNVSLPINEKFF